MWRKPVASGPPPGAVDDRPDGRSMVEGVRWLAACAAAPEPPGSRSWLASAVPPMRRVLAAVSLLAASRLLAVAALASAGQGAGRERACAGRQRRQGPGRDGGGRAIRTARRQARTWRLLLALGPWF